MYYAFLNMREEAVKADNNVVYHLSDLFHLVPKLILEVEKGERNFDGVLETVVKKAEAIGIERWVKSYCASQ